MALRTEQRLAESFAEARNNLEGQWARGDERNTEDLRVALREYRSFFQTLVERPWSAVRNRHRDAEPDRVRQTGPHSAARRCSLGTGAAMAQPW